MPKRLLLVVNHAGYFLSHRLPVALRAREEGWDVHVATPRSRHVPRIEAAGLAWHGIRLTRSGRNPANELATVRDLRALYGALAPDLVHQVTSKPVLYGTTAARMAGVPAVINALAGLGHLYLSTDLAHRILRRGVRLGYRFAMRHPHMKVIFQNEDDRRLFVDARLVRVDQTVIIPGSGVDTTLFAPRVRGDSSAPVVVFPSRMLYTKGVVEFVDAAKSLLGQGVAARFLLVGEPDPDNPASVDQKTLESWTAAGIEYCGRSEDMPAVYAGADIVCLPSYREGMPKVLLEAAASGLPSVTTDTPGCRDAVVDGVNGLLVPLRDSAATARALRRLIESPELRRSMGAEGRRMAEEKFSLQRILDQTMRLYGEMSR